MNDDALRRSYARHLADRGVSGRERCVPPEALLAVLERSGNDAARLATLDHVGACAACARDLDLLRAVYTMTSAGLAAAEAGGGGRAALEQAAFWMERAALLTEPF